MVPPLSYYTPSTIGLTQLSTAAGDLCIWIQTVLWNGSGLALGHNILRPFPHLVFIGAGWLDLGELVSECPVPRLLHQQTVIIPAVITLAVTMQQWSESGKCADRRLMELCPRPHAALPPPNI